MLQGREADRQRLSSAKVKNGGAILPLPMPSWNNAYLINHRDNFAFLPLRLNKHLHALLHKHSLG
jgi:hypothetical protein